MKIFTAFKRPACFGVGALLVTISCGLSPGVENEVQEEAGHDSDLLQLTPQMMEIGDIRIEKSRLLQLQTQLQTTGIVAQNETKVAHIRPLSSGVIEEVYVQRGDRVEPDQPLVLYDNIELGELIGEYLSLQAQLRKDLAQLEVAQRLWERGVQLLDVQALAAKEVEVREAEHKNAGAMVESRRAEVARIDEKLHRFGLSDDDIRELGTAGHDEAGLHRTKSHNTLRAPFGGVIIGYDVAAGELVEPDRQLLMLADVREVWVLADIYEKDLGLVLQGTPVEIRSEAYPDRTFRGTLTYISDVLDSATRTAKVRCVVSNLDGALKLEMFVSVSIPTAQVQTSVAVPESAVQNVDGQDVVFVDLGDNTFQRLSVDAGLSSGGWTAVTGLAEGTPVVSTGSFYLKSLVKREAIGEEH